MMKHSDHWWTQYSKDTMVSTYLSNTLNFALSFCACDDSSLCRCLVCFHKQVVILTSLFIILENVYTQASVHLILEMHLLNYSIFIT